jgi:hypothetical protein
MSRSRASALLALVTTALVLSACADATAPSDRPNFACESQGSGNAYCPPK